MLLVCVQQIMKKEWWLINKVILIGRLTKDVDVRYTQTTNTLVANFTLAVNRRFAKEGQQQADFINIIVFAETGEFCKKYFSKGQQVAVVGRIQTRNWDDDQGQKHYVTEVIAEEAYFADSKRDGDMGGNNFDSTLGAMPTSNTVSSENSDFETFSGDSLPF